MSDLNEVLGGYREFFTTVFNHLDEIGISLAGYTLSHVGFRTESIKEYEEIRDRLKELCSGYVENMHNGRFIAKLLLRNPLELPYGFDVSLIELMPPKADKKYKRGYEHLGVTLGKDLKTFSSVYANAMTGRQDQGPYCQPVFIRFKDGTRVKFYEYSLKDVVEKEGHVFKSP